MNIAKVLVGIGGTILIVLGIGVLYSKGYDKKHPKKEEPEREFIEYKPTVEKKSEKWDSTKWTNEDVQIIFNNKNDISKKVDAIREGALQEIMDSAESGALDEIKEDNVDYDIIPDREEDEEEFEDAMYEDVPDVDEMPAKIFPPYAISEDEFGENDGWDRPIYYHYFRDDDTLVEQEQWTVENGENREKIVGDLDAYFMYDDDIDEKVVYIRNENQHIDCQITGHNCSWVSFRNGEA